MAVSSRAIAPLLETWEAIALNNLLTGFMVLGKAGTKFTDYHCDVESIGCQSDKL
ncbi:hypothetical protein IQ243_24935 [Nostocales cyanobacterium LEGE 11386]|nr:hypothetical protein [Nostocales cyanobacterium LEGE 11386]